MSSANIQTDKKVTLFLSSNRDTFDTMSAFHFVCIFSSLIHSTSLRPTQAVEFYRKAVHSVKNITPYLPVNTVKQSNFKQASTLGYQPSISGQSFISWGQRKDRLLTELQSMSTSSLQNFWRGYSTEPSSSSRFDEKEDRGDKSSFTGEYEKNLITHNIPLSTSEVYGFSPILHLSNQDILFMDWLPDITFSQENSTPLILNIMTDQISKEPTLRYNTVPIKSLEPDFESNVVKLDETTIPILVSFPFASPSRNFSADEPIFNQSLSFSKEFGGRMDVMAISSNMIFAVFAIVFNFSVSSFYRRQIKNLIAFIYFSVSTTDLITALSCLSHPVIFVLVLFTNQNSLCSVLIIIFYCISCISIRVGVFFNLVLSVVRSINIVRPFYQVRLAWVKTACLICPISWCLVAVYDIYWVLSLGYMNFPKALFKFMIYMPMLGNGAASRILRTDPTYLETVMFGMTVPFIVPAIIVIICFVFQIYHLNASKIELRSTQKIIRRRPAITIFQLTLLFLICNCSATAVYFYFFVPSGREQRRTGAHDARLMYLSSCVLHVINATFSPAIMVLRGRSLKKAIKAELISIISKMSTRSSTVRGVSTGVKTVVHRY